MLARLYGSQRFGKTSDPTKKGTDLRAMRAEKFNGYEALKLVDLPKPTISDGRVLLRVTAAGVTPLDHTILSGHFPIANAPLVLGNEGAGVVEEGGGTDFPAGSRSSPLRPHMTVWREALDCQSVDDSSPRQKPCFSMRNLHSPIYSFTSPGKLMRRSPFAAN